MNDIADRERDRLHPLKRGRPIAAGLVPGRVALLAATALAAVALPVAFRLSGAFGAILLVYLALSVGYSLFLKRLPVVELATVPLFYLGRVWAGALVLTVPLSVYLAATTYLGALVVAVAKRLQEEKLPPAARGSVLVRYRTSALRTALFLSSAAALAAYGLWVIHIIQERSLAPLPLLGSILFVALGLWQFVSRVATTRPYQDVEAVLWHPLLLATIAIWLVMVTLPFYVR